MENIYDNQKYSYSVSHHLQYKYSKLIKTLPVELANTLRAQRMCGCYPITSKIDIERNSVLNYETGEILTYSLKILGAYHCKNSWTCPICSVRNLNKHRNRIDRILIGAEKENQVGIMVTVGVPHYKDESIELIMLRLKNKIHYVTRNGSYKRQLAKLNSIGSVISTEVTYTPNGWNLHQHRLIFIDKDKLDKLPEYEEWCLKRSTEFDEQCYRGKRSNPDNIPAYWYISRNEDNTYKFTKNADYVTANLISKELTYGNYKGSHHIENYSLQLLDLLDSNNPYHNQLFLDFALTAHKFRLIRVKYSPKIMQHAISDDEYNKLKAETLKNLKAEYIKEVVCSFIDDDWNKIIYIDERFDTQHILNIKTIIINQGNYQDVYNYCYEHRLPLPYNFNIRITTPKAA